MDSIILLSTFLAMFIVLSFLAYDFFKMSKESKTNQKETYKNKKWQEAELIVASFIATYYRTSNDMLIGYTALEMNRKTTSLIRKINRLRGIKTGKSPNASKMDIDAINTFTGESELNEKYILDNALYDLGIDLIVFHSFLINALKNKPIREK